MKIQTSYKLSSRDVEKIQRIELEILKQFIKCCSILNLTYYLHGGTLLGAVKYNSFIPWDDDIDVSMPRDDYEKFLKCGQKYLPKNYFLQTCYTDKYYTLCFAKIRNTDTKLIEYSLQNRCKMINGVYIDIFPIDGFNTKKIPFLAKCYRRRIDMSYWKIEKFSYFKKFLILISIFPLIFISANKATKMLDKYRQKKRTPNSSNPNYVLINRWFYPSSYYLNKKTARIRFCDISCQCVKNPESWLYIDYPQWPIIPDKSKQIPGHNLVYHKF